MQEEQNPQSIDGNQGISATVPSEPSAGNITLPQETVKQDSPVTPQPVIPPPIPTPQSLPVAPPQPSTLNPSMPATGGQPQIGMSASQMGFTQPRNKLFNANPKKLIASGVVVLALIGGVFALLVALNVIALSEFKTINYANSKGTHYNLDFYTKHSTKQLQSGNTQLVSKISRDGKLPLVLSIDTGEASGYNRVKDCTGFAKVFEVQNNNLNQKISVCDFGKQSGTQTPSGAVYVAGFMLNNQSNIITIGQDYSRVDLSSPNAAQESLTKFGLEPYKEDIQKIIASIKAD